MGSLILGVIVDVLIHVPVEDFQGIRVIWIPASVRLLAVLDTAELVVLDPEIGLEDLRRGREPQHGGVAVCDFSAVTKRLRSWPNECGTRAQSNCAQSDAAKESSPSNSPRWKNLLRLAV